MANVPERMRGYFQWDIYNPFLPRRDLETMFYTGITAEYPWRVVFEPTNSGTNFREFTITVSYKIRCEEPPDEVILSNVKLNVHKVSGSVERRELGHILFTAGFRYKHRFHEIVTSEIGSILSLSFKLEFELTPPVEDRHPVHFYDHIDLWVLSDCMKRLRDEEENKDMILWSKHRERAFHVHSYIMDSRWNNLRRVHRPRDEIETHISGDLLSDIITYMYSGESPVHSPRMNRAKYVAELSRVVDVYRLGHLYQLLMKNNFRQHPLYRTHLRVSSQVFPLKIVENRGVNNFSYTWEVKLEKDDQHGIAIRIQVENEAGYWLSYSLKSRYPSIAYVEVTLEVVKQEDGAPETTLPVDGRYVEMPPDATVCSRPVLFLGCPETFGNSHSRDCKYSIRCFLNVSNGKIIMWMEDVGYDKYRSTDEVLSDHMRAVYRERPKARMRISCSDETEPYTEQVHKEIFNVRAPNWRQRIATEKANITERPLTDTAECNLAPESLQGIAEYIYLGKLNMLFPLEFMNQIEDFAEETGLDYLQYVRRQFNQAWGWH